MFGFINLNKPAGFTSHDCVAKVRRLLKTKKVGHGGTLDPAATGVLPIAVGKATRLLQFLPEKKAYRARIRLGVTTTTDDLEGEIIKAEAVEDLSLTKIAPYLDKLTGTIEQTPPIYSAIKQGGKKLYQLARKGEQVEIPPRIVTIDKLEIINFWSGEFPELELEITCSPGTYIRAIARDLGAMLGCGGTLAVLIRTESCGMKLTDSLTLEQIEEQMQPGNFSLIKPIQALAYLETIILDSVTEAQRWCQGQTLTITSEANNFTLSFLSQKPYLKVCYLDHHFLGIGQAIDQGKYLLIQPKIVLDSPENFN